MKKNEFIEKFMINILYADLNNGNTEFLKQAYKSLDLYGNERIIAMRKRNVKIMNNPLYAVHEDIIAIILKEVCQKKNKKLYDEFMDYYLKRFPNVKKDFEENGNDICKWQKLWDEIFSKEDLSLTYYIQKNYSCLYCITYGENKVVNEFFKMWNVYASAYLIGYLEGNIGTITVIEDILQNLKNDYKTRKEKVTDYRLYERFMENQRYELGDYYAVDPEDIEDTLFMDIIKNFCSMDIQDSLDEYILKDNPVSDMLDDICKDYKVSGVSFDENNAEEYLDMLKEIFKKWCMKVVNFRDNKEEYLGYDAHLFKTVAPIAAEQCVSDLQAMFWFECYMMNLQKLWDDYYKKFTFEDMDKDNENLFKENGSLKEELSKYRKKIQQYEDDEIKRKQQQNKEVKANERIYAEEISSLKKQLEEKKRENEKQCCMLADRDMYIDILENRVNDKPCDEKVDISSLYNKKIVFIGGMPDTVSRLKAIFSNAVFIGNETMDIPQKIDLIVLLSEFMNHALCYKYIGLAREKDIHTVYCNNTNIQAVTQKVCSCF